eukprot:4714505-Pyramimonas_sp.AAC.1
MAHSRTAPPPDTVMRSTESGLGAEWFSFSDMYCFSDPPSAPLRAATQFSTAQPAGLRRSSV